MGEQHKVSIIVPIYNVEKYLSKCVESIIKQTYQNIEIILVDDGATDSCPSICDKYKAQDSRIVVIHKKNGGLSEARNSGIDIASGEYLFFVDSDDYIDLKTVSTLVRIAQTNNADIVECGVVRVSEEEDNPFRKKISNDHIRVLSHDEALKEILDYKSMIVAWNKLYRRTLFEEIRFPVGKIHEDEYTIPYLVDKCNIYCLTALKLYAYVQRNNSIMSMSFSPKRKDIIEAYRDRIDYFGGKYNNQYDLIIKYHFYVACIELKVIMGKEFSGSEVEETLNSLKKEILSCDNSMRRKIKVIAYSWFPKICVKHNKG